jgi:hypothetical protein
MIAPLKNPLLLVERTEQVSVLRHAFGRAKE